MKQLLQTVCALLCAVACSTGQTDNATQKAPPPSSAAAPVQRSAPATPPAAPQDNKPVVAPPDASPTTPGVIQPGCDFDKTAVPEPGTGKGYVIGPLDVLEIKVWNNANLSGIADVGPDGMISMQLIGQIKADGETVFSLTRIIRTRLANSVFECPPEVNIQVVRVNSKKYYIYGGVMKQGEFPLTGEMTVMDALANCGGFKEFANLKKITIQRGDKIFPFNYKEVSRAKNMAQNIKLQNGDRIFVKE